MRPAILLFGLLSIVAGASASADDTFLNAKKLYRSPDEAPLSDAMVVVAKGKITAVGPRANTPDLTRARSLGCDGGVVVAGFQNSHVHFMEETWNDAAHAPAGALRDHLTEMLTRFGYTTVFDTGSDQANTIALRARIEKGDVAGPRILTVGLPLYPPDGLPVYIRDLPPDVLARMHQPKTADEARAQVRENLARGADGTKLFLHTSPDGKAQRFMSIDVARAAAEETHRQHKLVFAHPTSLDGVRGAIASGVDILVHTTLGEPAPWDATVIEQLKARNMSVIPTFKLWIYELKKENVPPAIIDKLVDATLAELRAFAAADGQILFGTDVGYMHDHDPTEEYELMARAGLTPTQILKSLTTAPAARWNEGDRRGRIDVRFDADLVVLDADPADDVRNFSKVRCVFRGGKQIYPAATAH